MKKQWTINATWPFLVCRDACRAVCLYHLGQGLVPDINSTNCMHTIRTHVCVEEEEEEDSSSDIYRQDDLEISCTEELHNFYLTRT